MERKEREVFGKVYFGPAIPGKFGMGKNKKAAKEQTSCQTRRRLAGGQYVGLCGNATPRSPPAHQRRVRALGAEISSACTVA